MSFTIFTVNNHLLFGPYVNGASLAPLDVILAIKFCISFDILNIILCRIWWRIRLSFVWVILLVGNLGIAFRISFRTRPSVCLKHGTCDLSSGPVLSAARGTQTFSFLAKKTKIFQRLFHNGSLPYKYPHLLPTALANGQGFITSAFEFLIQIGRLPKNCMSLPFQLWFCSPSVESGKIAIHNSPRPFCFRDFWILTNLFPFRLTW